MIQTSIRARYCGEIYEHLFYKVGSDELVNLITAGIKNRQEEKFCLGRIQKRTWRSDGSTGWATKNFTYQIEKNAQREDVLIITNNCEGHIVTSFLTVTARKVRYYVPAYSANCVRPSEISVEALIRD